MVNQLLSTPDPVRNLNENDTAHMNDLTEELNSLAVTERYIPDQSINGEIEDDNKTANEMGSTTKYYSVFGPQLASFENNFRKPEGESLSTNSGEYQIDKSGEGSRFSIGCCISTSISPINEMVESQENSSPEGVHSNRKSSPMALESNWHGARETSTHRRKIFCDKPRGGRKYTTTRTKRNRSHRQRKPNRRNRCSNISTSSDRRELYEHSEARSSLSNNTHHDEKSHMYRDQELSSSHSISRRKGIRNRYPYEMYMNSTRPLTYVEGQKMLELVIKDNMVFGFATDKGGSRFLQEHLKSASPVQLWTTFALLKPDFITICEDVFGNYVAQKYLELGSVALRTEIVKTLSSSMSSLSLGMYGCRVVQKLLECVRWEHKKSIAKQLEGSIINFVYDQNGNHVVQKMIECLGSHDVEFMADEIIGHTYSLSVHPYGCRIIQRLLEKVGKKKSRPLLNEIKQHTVALSKNQYGNYIIQ